MKATLSILGLLEMDPTLLDGMTIPTGLSLDTLKNNIILECAELEVLYSSLSFFKWAVDAWSLKESPTWEKMYAALQIEYNPLENYDREETWSENGSHSTTGNRTENWTDTHEGENASTSSNSTSGEERTTMSGTEETDVSGTKNGTTSETESTNAHHFVFGYNDNTQVEESSDTGSRTNNSTTTETDSGTTEKTTSGTGNTTTTGTASGSSSGTDSATDERSGTIEDTNTGTTTGARTGRVHGNIGVTTSQQMLKAEFDLAPEINMYNIITRSFRNRFCLLIY